MEGYGKMNLFKWMLEASLFSSLWAWCNNRIDKQDKQIIEQEEEKYSKVDYNQQKRDILFPVLKGTSRYND